MKSFAEVRQGVLEELDSRRLEIEKGELNWLAIKITLNRGDTRITSQCERECSVHKSNGRPPEVTDHDGDSWRRKWGNAK